MEVITLGSKSPRRLELLKRLDYKVVVKPPKIKEEMDLNLSVEENAIKISMDKLNYIKKHNPDDKWILTADTFIVYNNKTLGKPIDRTDAFNMLKLLSGKRHKVLTGICIYSKIQNKILTDVDVTEVHFKKITDAQINDYLSYNEWQDAAGSYQIQNRGEILVQYINGSFSSVMGLPISRIYGMFTTLNFNNPVI
ncbi:MAG: Maf family protein [Spirochaetaceae bacterium]